MNYLATLTIQTWYKWAHLYDGVPYGNPYGAIAMLVLIVAAIGWVIKAIADACR